ncbi:hypothetical protein HDU97_005535 [Phlyctochytrium planicorne]|nr:hypothetical protein HDU97_005535 [Phlyctochytrium planicorne]
MNETPEPQPPPPRPSHTVQLSIKLNYDIDKTSQPFHVKRLNELKQQGQISKVVLKKEDYIHSFFVTFCGPSIEGKSPPLVVEANSWTSTFEVPVDIPLIHSVLGSPLEVCIFENIKIPSLVATERSEKAGGGGRAVAGANLKFNLANTGLTSAQQRIRKAKLKKETQETTNSDSVSNDNTEATRIDGGASVTSKGAFDHNEPYSDVKPTTADGIRQRPASGSSKENTIVTTVMPSGVLVPLKKESKPVKTFVKSTKYSNCGVSSSDEEGERGRKESPHPHHYDHPERYTSPTGGLKRSRSALSLSNLNQIRPKTPPQPHHHDHPIPTLFPRRNRSASASKDSVKAGSGLTVASEAGAGSGLNSSEPQHEHYGLNTATLKETVWNTSDPSTIETCSKAITNSDGQGSSFEEKLSQSKHSFPAKESRNLAALDLDLPPTNAKSKKTRFHEDTQKTDHGATYTDSLLDPESVHYILAYKEEKAKRERRGQYSLESRKALVGSIKIDLTPLVLGEKLLEGRCETKIGGLSYFTCEMKLNEKLLSNELQRQLNPLAVTIDKTENMPRTPLTYEQLDKQCHPTFVTFRFFNGPTLYASKQDGFHRQTTYFKATHVILLGLFDPEKLKEQLTSGSFVVQVFDRHLKNDGSGSHIDPLTSMNHTCPRCPYGEAKFGLSEIFKGAKNLRLRAPILPCPRIAKPCIPPGLWVESGSTLSIRITTHNSPGEIFTITPIDQCFYRLLLVMPGADSFASAIEDIICSNNSETLYIFGEDTETKRKALKNYPLGEEIESPYLDIIGGFCFFDDDLRIFVFECPRGNGFDRLAGIVESFLRSVSDPQLYSWVYWPCHQRIWKSISATTVHIRLLEPLSVSSKLSKNYIHTKIGNKTFDCLTFLTNTAFIRTPAIASARFRVPSISSITEFVQFFGQVVDFEDILSSESEESISDIEKDFRSSMKCRIDHTNKSFDQWVKSRKALKHNFINLYKEKYCYESLPRLRDRFGPPVFNYSIQKLSSAALKLEEMRSRMEKETNYYYSKEFDLPLAPISNQ